MIHQEHLSYLEKLPEVMVYKIIEYLNLVDFLSLIRVSKSLSSCQFVDHHLETLYQNKAIFKKPYLLQRLLNHKAFELANTADSAFRYAIQYNHADAVALLLKDSRVDPSANDNQAIRQATRNGHTRTVEIL
ncbi:hypothetical protein BC833DRAFT_360016, partial [Globomyces pollinis-pini]